MAGLVQRVPAGLLAVLNAVSSGENPRTLDDAVRGSLDLLQFYALSQRQMLGATNAALAEGATLSVVLPASWCVFFGAEAQYVKTATLTALRGSISIVRATGSSLCVASDDLGPFTATNDGTARLPFFAPYPILLPPSSVVLCRADIIGTDANVNATLAVELGVLG